MTAAVPGAASDRGRGGGRGEGGSRHRRRYNAAGADVSRRRRLAAGQPAGTIRPDPVRSGRRRHVCHTNSPRQPPGGVEDTTPRGDATDQPCSVVQQPALT